MKLTLDLHPIYNNQQALDIALRRMMFKAVATKAQLVEIIPGKGSGKLKHRVLAFLAQHQIRRLYDRVETTEDNTGVVYVHMRRSP